MYEEKLSFSLLIFAARRASNFSLRVWFVFASKGGFELGFVFRSKGGGETGRSASTGRRTASASTVLSLLSPVLSSLYLPVWAILSSRSGNSLSPFGQFSSVEISRLGNSLGSGLSVTRT